MIFEDTDILTMLAIVLGFWSALFAVCYRIVIANESVGSFCGDVKWEILQLVLGILNRFCIWL